MFKNISLKYAFPVVLLALVALWSACEEKEDELSNEVTLYSFGPSVLRGGQLKFIGENLEDVERIILPKDVVIEASEFDSLSAKLIVINVPDDVVEGLVSLQVKGKEDNLVTKTPLSILEPITITSMPDKAVRPGSIITIKGTYLNLIEEVVFATNKSVTAFEEQSRGELKLMVPADAQTGTLVLLDSEEIPNEIQTEEELMVTLPAISGVTPLTVKAGSNVTIKGSNLDLVMSVEFGGSQIVDSANFVSATAGQIVVAVPAATNDGEIALAAPSTVKVTSTEALTLVVPTLTDLTPNPAKTGQNLTVTGTNLDLVSQVVFAGDKEGTIIAGGSDTSITVEIPADAESGTIEFRTQANKSVTSVAVDMVRPGITTMTAEVKLNEDITITGENLDIVKEVWFTGGTMGTIGTATETNLVVTVPVGTNTGVVTLVANNGVEVVSTSALTILAEVPVFDSFPAKAEPGEMLTLTGEKLNLTNEVVFPGDVKATKFGNRTTEILEVYVPDDVQQGMGKITFTTYGTDFTESTDINFTALQDLAVVIYEDVNNSPFGQGGGWGTTTTDFASTEMVRSGSASVKVTYGGDWGGACQLGTWGNSPLSTAGMTSFLVSVYGGDGVVDGQKLALNISGSANGELTLTAGEWTDFVIDLSVFGSPAEISEVWFQDQGVTGTVYMDHIGLK
ncbi:IPT/TIG domain-containing protein [Reichenbachiella agariperforans]|uniref:IPT/TIG domain-containing protein n=1 Tax=Reichenbachiella agariperforans TaxID=156994 RepID=A0A1M6PZY4_REIAG|nr:IPT/TIG domain-containing protein [Reichenbachiella agariperforans]SHK13520.1 IPT/TIG domain-containing protein [Reichenbachiella agariperforans]